MNTPQTSTQETQGLPFVKGSTVDILRVLNKQAPAVVIANDMRTANARTTLNELSNQLDHGNALNGNVAHNLKIFQDAAKNADKSKRIRVQELTESHNTLANELGACLTERDNLAEQIKHILQKRHTEIPKLLEQLQKGEITLSTVNEKIKPLVEALDKFAENFNQFQKRVKAFLVSAQDLSIQTHTETAIVEPTKAAKPETQFRF